ncbi:MAG: PD40 domain-containing protein, partial [Solirubrobacterales bacterium]|nr:PD40 domain-containing protein [Solirubrobacterales bacterium]
YLDLPDGAVAGGESGSSFGDPEAASISGNGRYVAFPSDANTLSSDAHPDVGNIFRKDRTTGAVELVSRANGAGGAGPSATSHDPRISGNGNLVAFLTKAKLAASDNDGEDDVYVRNVGSGATTLATPGTTTPVERFDLSSNGAYIAFSTNDGLVGTDLNADIDVYRRNLSSGTTDLVSRTTLVNAPGNGFADDPTISGDGRWVAFGTSSTDLILGFANSNGGSDDIFARDMGAGINYLVSANSGNPMTGSNGDNSEPAIAGTPGAAAEVRIAYTSRATDVAAGGVDPSTDASVYRRSLTAVGSVLVSRATGGGGANANSRAHTAAISDDGQLITFASDATNLGAGADYYGVYLRDLGAATTTLASAKNEYAVQSDIAGDGSFASWVERGATPDSDPDVFGIFGRTLPGGPVGLVARPPGNAPFLLTAAEIDGPQEGARTVSGDGRYVVFRSNSSRFPDAGPGHVFRRDLETGEVVLVSRADGAAGAPAGSGGRRASISSDGSRVSFITTSALVPADTNAAGDAYVRDIAANTTTLASRDDGPGGAVAVTGLAGSSSDAAISGDGTRVAFNSDAANLEGGGADEQVYVRDLESGETILASRANGMAGAIGDRDSRKALLSDDGTVVVFESTAANLDPADAIIDQDVYVRNLTTDTILLASRAPGLAGAKLDDGTSPAISGDGKVVAFETNDDAAAPGTPPWPAFVDQIVSRELAGGNNTLVSRVPGGAVADRRSQSPSLNTDGSVIAFQSLATNLIAGLGGNTRHAVFARQMDTGALGAPPAFGLDESEPEHGSGVPSISDNGQCLHFAGRGHNETSGDASDVRAGYMFVVSGTCSDPRGNPVVEPPAAEKPKLTKVSIKPKRFTVGKKKTARVA